MVDIKIDDIYRKPSNFFQLEFASQGKVYRVPQNYTLRDGQFTFTIYDRETGGYFSCIKLSDDWEEVKAEHWILKSFLVKFLSLALKKNQYLTSRRGKASDISYLAYSFSSEIENIDKDIYKVFDGFEHRIVLVENTFCLYVMDRGRYYLGSAYKE